MAIVYVVQLLAKGFIFALTISVSSCTISQTSYVPTSPCTSTRTSCSCPSSPRPVEGACARFLYTSRHLSVLLVNTSSGMEMPFMLITSSAPGLWRCLRMGWSLPYWVSHQCSTRVQLCYFYNCYYCINNGLCRQYKVDLIFYDLATIYVVAAPLWVWPSGVTHSLSAHTYLVHMC